MDRKPLILAVDDIPVNQLLIKSQLRFSRYDVITASGGREALELIVEHHPDAVLLDIMMPEMDGLEVLEAIRSNPETENLPVIMLTSLSEMEYHNSADAKGANGYLTKPLVSSQLIETLDSLFPCNACACK